MTTVQPLESYYSAIRDAISGNHLSLAAEKAIAGLRDHPGEAEFIKIEIVALIKQEQSRKALDAIRKARSAKLIPAKVLQYEEAYCYFMLGSYDEARVILKKIKPSNAVDCLLAQIAYKREQFSECVNIYKGLLSAAEPDSQEYNDLLLNLSAASAAKAQQDGKDSLETASDTARGGYEFLFNSATRLLACDKVHEAIKLLNDASENAKEGLAALGWSDGDIQSEIGPINAQKAVALQYLGKNSEARSIYSDLLSQKNTDRIANDIATHNMATISVCGNVYSGTTVDKAKRVLQIPGHSFGSLTCAQQALMHYNMAVVLLHQNQYFSARRVLCLLGKRFPNVALPSGGAASAIASLKVGSPHKALYEFLALSHVQAPIKSAFASLAAAQIAIGLGKPEQGASVLHEWLEKAQSVQISDLDTPSEFVYHYFGISMLMSWLSSEGDLIETTAPAASTAAEHLYSQFTKIKAPSPELLVAIGDCLEYSGDSERARSCFERAMAAGAQQSKNMSSVLALGERNRRSTQQILKGYSRRARVHRSVPGVCTRFARQFQSRANKAPSSAAGSSPRDAVTSNARKGRNSSKYRAQRLRKLHRNPPKDYDPTRKADSERWIPLQQRSYYKPRGRNRKQQALRGGAQGGILEAGSGLGGTGSARISGKAARSAQQTQSPDDDSASDAAATTTRDVDTGSTKQKTSKPKPKGNKGKGKGKGKKGSW
ncbi:Srp72p [Coemansia sp. RSA 1813]|nr:Signal recognition particle subunit SRP72 [Coemansia sp. RSA 1646]KAJ2093477.1 Srp72p [Coemansia sp. RSA 986]KAJ2214296.1 Srp72p [Coemansia sp. RSA 487]KAJ2568864.1 Srp72p [Coemansia sp. RSA 1813]